MDIDVWVNVASALVGVVGGLGGAVVGGNVQARLQRRSFERDDRATRAIVQTLILDSYRYVDAAARFGEFRNDKWRPSVQRLLDGATQIETAHAFEEPVLELIVAAALELRHALERLESELPPNPFLIENRLGGTRLEIERRELQYVGIVRGGIVKPALEATRRAMEAVGLGSRVGDGVLRAEDEIVRELRFAAGVPTPED